jgi:hypothetical protein
MTAVHAAMNLNGPFRAIADAIQAGAATIPEIKAKLPYSRRRAVGKNCATMVGIGLLTEAGMKFTLTDKCRTQMSGQPKDRPHGN